VSTLYLVRHGQAHYTADEPPLSDLGAEQARRLGRHAAARGWQLDALYHGPRKRQIDTTTHMMRAMREAGMHVPEPVQVDDFDEYHAQAILRACTPRLAGKGSEFEHLFTDRLPDDPAAQRRRFNRFFERSIELWLGGELGGEAVEPFLDFAARVARGMHHVIRREGRGKRVMVVTSAGCIAASMRLAVGLDDATTLKQASIIWNTSVTEYRYRDERELTLVGFNGVPHLDDPAHIT